MTGGRGEAKKDTRAFRSEQYRTARAAFFSARADAGNPYRGVGAVQLPGVAGEYLVSGGNQSEPDAAENGDRRSVV